MSKKLLIKSLVCAAALMSGSVAFADNADSKKSSSTYQKTITSRHNCVTVINRFTQPLVDQSDNVLATLLYDSAQINNSMQKSTEKSLNNSKGESASATFDFTCKKLSSDKNINKLDITVTTKLDPEPHLAQK